MKETKFTVEISKPRKPTDTSWGITQGMQNLEKLERFREGKIREILESARFLLQNFGEK